MRLHLAMKTVGVRELKDRLSEYLREVKAGESVLVTDRGAVIAEISSPEYANRDASVPPGLSALAKRGLLTLGENGGAAVYPALPRRRLGKFSSSQLLDEERGVP
jgi:prevent-host-death family protein